MSRKIVMTLVCILVLGLSGCGDTLTLNQYNTSEIWYIAYTDIDTVCESNELTADGSSILHSEEDYLLLSYVVDSNIEITKELKDGGWDHLILTNPQWIDRFGDPSKLKPVEYGSLANSMQEFLDVQMPILTADGNVLPDGVGLYQYDGETLLAFPVHKKLAKQRERIGCIIESPSLYLDMTAYENLEVQRLQRGIPGKGCIDNALALVGLKDTGKKKAKDFSLGMRQRLALAIALLGNPEFLVLDEPINGLDPTGIIELRNLLKRLNKERGITILISSHILTELHQLANRYGILHEGKLLQEITATELDKRCKKHLLLQVNDVAAASVLLESKLNTSNFSVMPDKSIHLYDYVENAGKVSALLSANNITIYQLAQSGDSLETYYTNLIGGCQND